MSAAGVSYLKHLIHNVTAIATASTSRSGSTGHIITNPPGPLSGSKPLHHIIHLLLLLFRFCDIPIPYGHTLGGSESMTIIKNGQEAIRLEYCGGEGHGMKLTIVDACRWYTLRKNGTMIEGALRRG